MDVPASFPRDSWPASLAGAQPKFSARLINGKYIVGLTNEERLERYLLCADLLEQMAAYSRRKRAQSPDEPLQDFLQRLEVAVRGKNWEVSPIEITWVLAQLKEQL